MKLSREIRIACACCASVLSATFASGREVSSFFAWLGRASWAGIVLSSVLFGSLMGMICRFAGETGARTLPGVYYAKLDQRCGDAVSVVYALLMLMMGAVALSTAGELALLAMDNDRAAWIFWGATLILAFGLAVRGMRPLSMLGIFIVPGAAAYFASLALDPRPAYADVYQTAGFLLLPGGVPAALILGALFAFLKSSMAGGIAASHAEGLRPARFGLCCALALGLTALPANWALQRAGEAVQALNLPMVVLAARWGRFGYYSSIVMMWIGSICVLSCSLGSLTALVSGLVRPLPGALLIASAVSVMSATGLRPLVSVGYPMLGWVCAICLGALAVMLERKKRPLSSLRLLTGAAER